MCRDPWALVATTPQVNAHAQSALLVPRTFIALPSHDLAWPHLPAQSAQRAPPIRNLSRKLISKGWEGEMRMRFLLLCLCVIASNASAKSPQAQALCAKQAETAYQAYNNAGSVPGFKVESSWHQSHYNKKLNKCLILVDQMYQYNGETSITAQLLDAFERRVFAKYTLNLNSNFKNCELTPTLDKREKCSSKNEFDAFVDKYMEE